MEHKRLVGRKEEWNRPRWDINELLCEMKIIFLNKANLAELEGYKASVKLKEGLVGQKEIHIVLTGFSPKSARALYDKLKALPKNEVYSEKKALRCPKCGTPSPYYISDCRGYACRNNNCGHEGYDFIE